MQERIQEKLRKYDWLVGEVNQEIVGYAYYGSFRPRAAYGHTVESTIYLSQASIGKGFGKPLYRNYRELIGGIALPNPQSLALHRKLGFVEVGVLKNVGHKFGKYIDVAFWQMSIA
jgi:L-amino acid N-acyltransferase YncA